MDNQNYAPVGQLKTNRGLLKYLLLTIITCGIYPIVYFSSISTDVNVICSRYDGKKTMHFCLLYFVVLPLTCSISYFVWGNNISARIGKELNRRGIGYSFGAFDFWVWNVLCSFLGFGGFVYIYRLSKAMNMLAEDYNIRG